MVRVALHVVLPVRSQGSNGPTSGERGSETKREFFSDLAHLSPDLAASGTVGVASERGGRDQRASVEAEVTMLGWKMRQAASRQCVGSIPPAGPACVLPIGL